MHLITFGTILQEDDTNGSHFTILGYLSADIICSETRTVFPRAKLEEKVRFEEQIISKDKYPSIFSPQMEAIVFVILQIFLNKGEKLWRPFLKII